MYAHVHAHTDMAVHGLSVRARVHACQCMLACLHTKPLAIGFHSSNLPRLGRGLERSRFDYLTLTISVETLQT